MSSQVDEDIRSSLLNISRLVREAGDTEISRVLESIIQRPDQIVALHEAFSKKLKCKPKTDSELALNERENWFRNFSSIKGEKLKSKTAKTLAGLTRNWDLSTEQIEYLLVCSVLWAKSPGLFWTGAPPDGNITRRCYNDLEEIDELTPWRRRILLITLSRQVEQDQKNLQNTEPTGRKRARGTSDRHRRDQRFLPNAMRSLTQQIWPDLTTEKQQKIQDKLTRYSLAGWKWRQLNAEEMVLACQNINVTLYVLAFSTISEVKAYHIRFERRPWPLIEIEAINCFIQTLPQYRNRTTLQKAFQAITDYYANRSEIPAGPEAEIQTRASAAESRVHSSWTDPTSLAADSNILADNWNSRERGPAASTESGLSFEDAQAAEVLSSITRDPRICQSHPKLIMPKKSSLAESLDNPTPANSATPSSPPPSQTSQEVLPPTTTAGADTTRLQPSPTLAQWAQDIGNPLSNWQSEPDPLDWGPSFFQEAHNLSNPLPSADDVPPVHQVDWSHYMVDWSNYMLSGSDTPPHPPDPGMMLFPVENI
ncbi:hypothetical protein N7522_006449 [Penicillium canescens]|nr:hypothetical protein N7522_006288 [Penicillium canescens]KAJ6003757.1 hypothetical protein N7522_006449 [Penicillium canescens]